VAPRAASRARNSLGLNELVRDETVWISMEAEKRVQILRTRVSARCAQTAIHEGESGGVLRSGTVVEIKTPCAHLPRSTRATSTRTQK
jgi:hypothetical protein